MIQVMQLHEFLENYPTLFGAEVDSPIEVQEKQQTLFFALSPALYELYEKLFSKLDKS